MEKRRTLLIASANPGKILEIREALALLPFSIADLSHVPKIVGAPQETGTTFSENALIKARFYHERTGFATLADDSGILVEALTGELGVHTRRWGAGPEANDDEWIGHFLKRMGMERNKRASFICALSYIDERAAEYLFEGRCDGVITDTLRADYLPGLPISSCFVPDGQTDVFSRLNLEQKNSTSHRGRALQKLVTLLQSYQN